MELQEPSGTVILSVPDGKGSKSECGANGSGPQRPEGRVVERAML